MGRTKEGSGLVPNPQPTARQPRGLEPLPGEGCRGSPSSGRPRGFFGVSPPLSHASGPSGQGEMWKGWDKAREAPGTLFLALFFRVGGWRWEPGGSYGGKALVQGEQEVPCPHGDTVVVVWGSTEQPQMPSRGTVGWAAGPLGHEGHLEFNGDFPL